MIKSVEQQIEELIPFEDFKNKWCETYSKVFDSCPNYEELFFLIYYNSMEDKLVDFTNKNFKNKYKPQ